MKGVTTTLSPRILALGLVIAASGCSGGSFLAPGQGRVQFTLASGSGAGAAAPAQTAARSDGWDGEHHDYRFFQTADVTLSSILARNDSGELVGVGMDLPTTVDVVAMDGAGQVSLPDGTLPAGTYDQLVVVMTQVNAVAHDGTQITFTPPGGGWTAIVPVCPFTVDEGASTTVSLQFMVHRAFTWRNGRFRFRPEFQCGEGGTSTGGAG